MSLQCLISSIRYDVATSGAPIYSTSYPTAPLVVDGAIGDTTTSYHETANDRISIYIKLLSAYPVDRIRYTGKNDVVVSEGNLYYSQNGSVWTVIGSGDVINTSYTSIDRTGLNVTAQYFCLQISDPSLGDCYVSDFRLYYNNEEYTICYTQDELTGLPIVGLGNIPILAGVNPATNTSIPVLAGVNPGANTSITMLSGANPDIHNSSSSILTGIEANYSGKLLSLLSGVGADYPSKSGSILSPSSFVGDFGNVSFGSLATSGATDPEFSPSLGTFSTQLTLGVPTTGSFLSYLTVSQAPTGRFSTNLTVLGSQQATIPTYLTLSSSPTGTLSTKLTVTVSSSGSLSTNLTLSATATGGIPTYLSVTDVPTLSLLSFLTIVASSLGALNTALTVTKETTGTINTQLTVGTSASGNISTYLTLSRSPSGSLNTQLTISLVPTGNISTQLSVYPAEAQIFGTHLTINATPTGSISTHLFLANAVTGYISTCLSIGTPETTGMLSTQLTVFEEYPYLSFNMPLPTETKAIGSFSRNVRYLGIRETIGFVQTSGGLSTDTSRIVNTMLVNNNNILTSSSDFQNDFEASVSLVQKYRVQILWRVGKVE